MVQNEQCIYFIAVQSAHMFIIIVDLSSKLHNDK
jgi:hypothetical protein